jgi:hypothetical protein
MKSEKPYTKLMAEMFILITKNERNSRSYYRYSK